MNAVRRLLVGFVGLLVTISGCGEPAPPPPDIDALAKAKVEAFQKLADAMANDPNGFEARAALEEIYVTPLDARKNRAQAEEIMGIYRQRIKGKYQGEVAQAVQGEITGIENALKQAN